MAGASNGNEECTHAQLREIALEFDGDVNDLGLITLGLKSGTVDACCENMPLKKDRVFNMLKKWFDTAADNSPTKLYEVLKPEHGISNSILKKILNPVDKQLGSVFISYRRSNGKDLASALREKLKSRGIESFLDVTTLRSGKFEPTIGEHVRNSKHFLLILSANALDKCKGDSDMNDWLHKEVCIAMESGSNIIPLLVQDPKFIRPNKEDLPRDIQGLLDYNTINWYHDQQDGCFEKILSFMKSVGR